MIKNLFQKLQLKRAIIYLFLDLILSEVFYSIRGAILLPIEGINSFQDFYTAINILAASILTVLCTFLFSRKIDRNLKQNALLYIILQLSLAIILALVFEDVYKELISLVGVVSIFLFILSVSIGFIIGYNSKRWTIFLKEDEVTFICFVILILMIILSSEYFFKRMYHSNMNSEDSVLVDKQLLAISSQTNENLPIMIDRDTRLDSTSVIEDSFVYNYTIINYSSEDINSKELSSNIQPQLFNRVCTNSSMKVFRDLKVKIVYKYHDKTGNYVTDISVDTKKCK